jgi:taurine dioxygenase
VVHPVARTHPITGRTAIYVSEGECVSISGMDDATAEALVTRLAAEIQKPDYRYVHDWREGDVLIWDNAAVQHKATFDYTWPDHRRLMWRITVGGTG